MHVNKCPLFKIYVIVLVALTRCYGYAIGQSAPSTCSAAIGAPANGSAHYININWSAVTSATAYQLQDSTPGVGWANLYSGTATSYAHNTGGTGNLPFFYRVNATSSGTSGWTNCAQFPIYNACNDTTPLLSNATSSTITATLQTSGLYANANNATYAIYCVTTNQYVQANGSLAATALYQTASAWGGIVISGLAASTNYCFYTEAMNHDGNIQTASNGSILAVQNFNTSSTLDVSQGSGSKWYSPNTCEGSSEIKWYSTGGCSGGTGAGVVGYTTSPGQYYGCFLRSPVFSAAGQSQIVLSFDLNSNQSFSGDSIYFYIWANSTNSYYPPSQPGAYGIINTINGVSTQSISLATADNCTHYNVVINLDSVPIGARSSLYAYINPVFFEFAGSPINVLFDNIGIGDGYQTTCLSTTSCSVATITSNPSSQTVCAGSNTSFSIVAGGSVISYQWQQSTDGVTWTNLVNNSTFSGVNTQSLIVTTTTAAMNGYQYRCSVTGSCGGTPVSSAATLNVNSVPAGAGNITGSSNVCASQNNVAYSIASVNGALAYNWVLPNGASIVSGSGTNDIRVDFAANASSGNLVVTPSNTCGNGSSSTAFMVGLNTIPATPAGITGPQSPCVSTAAIYSVNPITNASSYIWTLPGGWTGSSSTDSITTIPSSTAGNITVSAANTCGNSAPQNLIVSPAQSPATPGSISGNPIVCGTSGATYSITAVTGAIFYNWTLPTGWSGGSASNSITATPGANGGNISVSASNLCGTSGVQTLGVSVSQVPATPGLISGPATVCGTGAVVYSIAAVSGANSYTWTLPSGWTANSTSDSITVTPGSNSGSITVSAVNTCGNSPVQALAVSVSQVPVEPGAINGPTTVCSTGSNTYSVVAVPGANSYNWIFPAGWSGSSSTNSINATPGSSGKIAVSASNICGTSAAQILAVAVNSGIATITPNGATTFCQGDSVTLTASTGSAYLWSDNETTSSINVANSGNYFVTVTEANGCAAVSQETSVTVNSLPNATISPTGDISICQGTSVKLTAAYNTFLQQQYAWSNGGATQSILIDSAGTYFVTATANGCTAVSAAVVVTVIPAPVATVTASGPLSFCTGGSVTLTAADNSTYAWSSGQTMQGITLTKAGSYIVTVTNAYQCTAASAAKVVKVNALPKATVTVSGATSFCTGGSVIITVASGSGYNYAWNNGASTQAITVSTSGSYVVTVNTTAGCSKVSATKKITVLPLPAASITIKGSICNGGSEVITEKKIGTDTYKWSTGATTNAIDVSVAGNYVVTVSSAQCSASAGVQVSCPNLGETSDDKAEIDNTTEDSALTGENSNLLICAYPNPANGEFHLNIQAGNADDINIRVFDVGGKLVEQRLDIAFTTNLVLGNYYAPGTYIVQVQQGDLSKQLRLVKVE